MMYLLKSFTKTMLGPIVERRAIEPSKTEINICAADDFNGSLAGLYRRGFMSKKRVMPNEKEILSINIIQAGKFF